MGKKEYEVRGDNNKLFCKFYEEDGETILDAGKGHRIEFNSLLIQVLCPSSNYGQIHRKKAV